MKFLGGYFTLGLVSSMVSVAICTSCSYSGQVYPSAPSTPIRGVTHTCFCEQGSWVRCYSNNNGQNQFASSTSTSSLSESNDPGFQQQTALKSRQAFDAGDFVFDLRNREPESTGLGGTIRVASLGQFPALAGQGVAYSLFQLDPCGINLPHVHPRATELIYVLKGTQLKVAFVEENSGRTVVNNMQLGQVTFFPEGLIHYQQNLGCDPVEFLSALNSEDPGVVTLSTRIFTLPSEALQATFALDAAQVDFIKQGIPAGPAKGRMECLKRCGMLDSGGWIDAPSNPTFGG